MDKIWPVALITLREGIRNRALQGILFVAVLLCFVYLTIIPMFAFDTGKVAVDLAFASISLAGLAIVVFLGIAMLTRDIHQRSVCMILARPISRTAYVVGKFIGLAIAILIAIVILSCLGGLTSWLGIQFIPEMDAPRNFSFGVLAIGILYHYQSLLILLAVAFLFCMITTSEYLSMLFTASVYIIGQSLETIVKVLTTGEFVQVGSTYIQALKALAWIFPNLRVFDLKVYISYGLPLVPSQLGWIAAYGIFYIAVILVLTILIFNRKEIR